MATDPEMSASEAGASEVGARVGAGAALLEGLDPSQLEAVTTAANPLCILAGAGSGKTRVLTRRIAYRVAVGSALGPHVLALTFTRRAAAELRSRLGALGVRDRVAAGTFHGIAYAQLRRRWADRGERPPALLEHKVRLLVPLLPARSAGEVSPADVATEVEWAKARMVGPEGYEAALAAAGRRPPLPGAVIASLYRRYEEEKARRRLVDLDDLVLLCAEALETDGQFAASQRWRFRHLFVDEFQDVNRAQLRLLEGWRGDSDDLCVVGDPDQAIYAWNGADPTALVGFGRRHAGAAVVHLHRNYRSSPQVVAVANAVIGDHRAPGAFDLRPTRSAGPVPRVVAYTDEADEAAGVARALRRHHSEGRPWRQMAVLARTRAQLVLFEEALGAVHVPTRLRGTTALLRQAGVREALADLRGRPPATLLSVAEPDLWERARSMPATGPDAMTGGDDRRAHLEQLGRMMGEQLALDPRASVGGFLAWLATTLDEAPASGADAVELATFHAAKGLEWPVVFLVGLEQGLVPVSQATTPEARAEERRLLYVAVTRAHDELGCSWAGRRAFGGRSVPRSPSPWLASVEAIVALLADDSPGTGWRGALEGSRARIRSLDGGRAAASGPHPASRAGGRRLGEGADPAVLEALRSWRAGAARAAGVPAFVVLHDTTLAAVAEALPADHQALVALPGIGPVKAGRYADALLAVVAGARAS